MKKKGIIEIIKELNKTPRGKGILFFGFYLIFFIILFVVMQLGKGESILKQGNYDQGIEKNNITYSFDKIKENNYKYKYSINKDGIDYIYIGEKNNNKEIFQYNGINYYLEKDKYFVNNNGMWILDKSPYINEYLLKIEQIEEIVEEAFLVSRTDYESGKEIDNYLVSSNTLNKIYYNKNTDIEEVANEIEVSTDEEKNVEKITLKLNSYCINNQECQNNLEVCLEYDDFGEVKEIENPVN